MTISEIKNFLQLDGALLTAGQPSEAQLTEVAAAKVQVVINLALSTSDNALPDEAATVTALGMKYFHIPVNWGEPTHQDLEHFMNVMDAHQGEKVLAHCAMNFRATAFTALWRVKRQGWDVEKAFTYQRRIWNLDEYPVWKAFVQQELK
jgi:uncharacterized protein (TIGR01244 family)